MKMRVLICFPNTSNDGVIPIAVGILSSIAKNKGCEVEYFETTFYNKASTASEERENTGEFKVVKNHGKQSFPPMEQLYRDFERLLNSYNPDLLAVHANSLEWEFFNELVNNVSFSNNSPIIVVGGVHATVDPESVIDKDYVDVVCVGEGEEAWEELIHNIQEGIDYSDIKNLWVKTTRGIVKNPMRQLISADMLWNCSVDYSLFGEKHLLKPFDGEMRRRGLIEYSRGCPFDCSYCVNSALKNCYKGLGKFFRVRPFESLIKGVKTLMDIDAEILQLQDECFFSNKYNDISKFCDWYKKECSLPLLLQTRPESVSREKVEVIASMDVPVQISLGVESGSERILKNICNRHMSLSQIKSAFAVIHEYGLRSNAYCMIGFPTETRDEVFETINLIREINPSLAIMSVFYPFQGVPLRKLCQDKGFINGNENARTFTDKSILLHQPMSPDEIQNIRRCFRLYTKLPERLFPLIGLCEHDYENHLNLFKRLVELSWSYDNSSIDDLCRSLMP